MADTLNWPPEVIQAATVTFSFPVTGFLMSPIPWDDRLVGQVFMDACGRFGDGRLIHTSPVSGLTEELGYGIAHTESGSTYVLVVNYSMTLEDLRVCLQPITERLQN